MAVIEEYDDDPDILTFLSETAVEGDIIREARPDSPGMLGAAVTTELSSSCFSQENISSKILVKIFHNRYCLTATAGILLEQICIKQSK